MSVDSDGGPCRLPKGLPVDQDLAALAQRRRDILAESLGDVGSRRRVRDHFKDALESQSNLAYAYRFLGRDFQLEPDLLRALDAFAKVDEGDTYQCAVPDLKLIRRRAFQRYAFCLAREANRRLRALGEPAWWLSKDLALPRIGLALPVGYAVLLGGKIAEWIWIAGREPLVCTIAALVCCLFAWFLIYTNVRDVVGNVSDARGRALSAFLIGLGWCGAFLLVGSAFAAISPGLRGGFAWGSGVLLTLGAYAIAVLVQFFFSRSGSIADPL